jgi:hypothetical protein
MIRIPTLGPFGFGGEEQIEWLVHRARHHAPNGTSKMENGLVPSVIEAHGSGFFKNEVEECFTATSGSLDAVAIAEASGHAIETKQSGLVARCLPQFCGTKM